MTRTITAATLALVLGAAPAALADGHESTALTIYSSAEPGAIPPEMYRPTPGYNPGYTWQNIPGYAVVRHGRTLDIEQGVSELLFKDVAALLSVAKVPFLASPGCRKWTCMSTAAGTTRWLARS